MTQTVSLCVKTQKKISVACNLPLQPPLTYDSSSKWATRFAFPNRRKRLKKGILPNWTEEVFSTAQRLRKIPPVYRVREHDGTMSEGTFYEREPQRDHQSEVDLFRMEKMSSIL